MLSVSLLAPMISSAFERDHEIHMEVLLQDVNSEAVLKKSIFSKLLNKVIFRPALQHTLLPAHKRLLSQDVGWSMNANQNGFNVKYRY